MLQIVALVLSIGAVCDTIGEYVTDGIFHDNFIPPIDLGVSDWGHAVLRVHRLVAADSFSENISIGPFQGRGYYEEQKPKVRT